MTRARHHAAHHRTALARGSDIVTTKPIGVVRIGRRASKQVVVVCEDGSGFIYSAKDHQWSRMAPIPGTRAAEDAADRKEGML